MVKVFTRYAQLYPSRASVRLYYGFAVSIGTLPPITALLPTLTMTSGDGSGGPASPTPTPTPTSTQTPTAIPQCAVAPAESNPPGGGGTPAQNQIDPDVYGRADMSKVTVFGCKKS